MIQRYSLRTKGFAWAVLAALMGTLLTGAFHRADADTFSYASQRRRIRACVLVVNTATGIGGGPQNAAPHLFYVLDKRTDVKPGGWEFVNPLAASTVTPDIANRW